MKSLAKGWEYAGLHGCGAGPFGVWMPGTGIWYEISRAPPECFADEPAEPIRNGAHGAYVNDGDPEPMIAALEKCLEQEQAKQEPKPPPRKYTDGQRVENALGKHLYVILGAVWYPSVSKWLYELRPDGDYPTMHLWENEIRLRPAPQRLYEDGQWVKLREECGTIIFHNPEFRAYKVNIRYGPRTGEGAWWDDGSCSPCPPPLTDAQRRLQPGDKVRVQKQRWDEKGKPLEDWAGAANWIIYTTRLRSGCVWVELESGMAWRKMEWLHNLNTDPAEEK